ncbi:MAG: hypothetical protein DMG57_08520 [Acidobacteria bacterium]|nr:MAG: hypothetical protein DMG57_08520 [Acidobacteriota bacterium]
MHENERAALRAQSQSTDDAVRAVLGAQQTAWNRGDVDAFMSGYESSDATTFVGARITKGQATGRCWCNGPSSYGPE